MRSEILLDKLNTALSNSIVVKLSGSSFEFYVIRERIPFYTAYNSNNQAETFTQGFMSAFNMLTNPRFTLAKKYLTRV